MVFSFETVGAIQQSKDLGCFDLIHTLKNPKVKISLEGINDSGNIETNSEFSKLVGDEINQIVNLNTLFKYNKSGVTLDTYILENNNKLNSFKIRNELDTPKYLNSAAEPTKRNLFNTDSKESSQDIKIKIVKLSKTNEKVYQIYKVDSEEVLCLNLSGLAAPTSGVLTVAQDTKLKFSSSFKKIPTLAASGTYAVDTYLPLFFKFDIESTESLNDPYKPYGFVSMDEDNNELSNTANDNTIEACRKKLKYDKDTKYRYFGMYDIDGKNSCYTIKDNQLENESDIFTLIEKDNRLSTKVLSKTEDDVCKRDSDTEIGLGSRSDMFIHAVDTGSKLEKVEIKNLPLQRWVCINLQIHNNIIDIFMDGLLYKTHIIQDGSPKPNNDNIIIGNNGGFDGYLSRTVYANKALHPGEIYQKYKEGPRISLTSTDRLKKVFGMGPKEVEERE